MKCLRHSYWTDKYNIGFMGGDITVKQKLEAKQDASQNLKLYKTVFRQLGAVLDNNLRVSG